MGTKISEKIYIDFIKSNRGGDDMDGVLSCIFFLEYYEVIDYVLENKDITLEEALIFSCETGNPNLISFILNKGANVHYKNDYALHVLEQEENDTCIYLLLSHGANIDVLTQKYYRKWRILVFRNFLRKIITPLYYSPGFPGYIKGKKEVELLC